MQGQNKNSVFLSFNPASELDLDWSSLTSQNKTVLFVSLTGSVLDPGESHFFNVYINVIDVGFAACWLGLCQLSSS